MQYVYIERQPQNPYDRNAVRAMTTLGVQVGHIPAKNRLAGLLSPFMERYVQERHGSSPAVRLEALVPLGHTGTVLGFVQHNKLNDATF
jgi:hypothetical protein